MAPRRALQLILFIGLFGSAFSGALTYGELFGPGAMSCPAPGAPGTVFGYPACVYGFFMYLIVTTLAALGLRGEARRRREPVAGTAGSSAIASARAAGR